MQGLMEKEGLPYTPRTMTFNTRRAQELAKWAESKGRGDEFHDAAFRAYFVDGKNIGKREELVALATSIGLPAEEAQTILQSRTFKDAVDSDWDRSRQMGITAVPTFLIGRETAVGAQPYEVLEQFLKANGAKKRGS